MSNLQPGPLPAPFFRSRSNIRPRRRIRKEVRDRTCSTDEQAGAEGSRIAAVARREIGVAQCEGSREVGRRRAGWKTESVLDLRYATEPTPGRRGIPSRIAWTGSSAVCAVGTDASATPKVPAEWRPLFAAALWTGMRRGELLALRKSDVDLALGTVVVVRSN